MVESERRQTWSSAGREAGHKRLPQMYHHHHVVVSMGKHKTIRNDYFGISSRTELWHATTENSHEELHSATSTPNSNITAPANTRNNVEATDHHSSPYYDFYPDYESSMKDVLQLERVIKGTKGMTEEDSVKVSQLLLSNLPAIPVKTSFASMLDKSAFQHQLKQQQMDFQQATNITDLQLQMAAKILTFLGDFCAKHRIYKPLFTAWEKIKEAGITLQEKTLSTYLYVLSTIDEHDCAHITNHNIQQEVATAHDLLFYPTEKTISLRIKSFVSLGDAQGAEQMLTLFQQTQSIQNNPTNDHHNINNHPNPTNKKNKKGADNLGQVKLRTFLPVLELYCQQGDIPSALKLYKDMRRYPSVLLDAETYTTLITAVAENGYFTEKAEPIQGAFDLGYTNVQCGPKFFDSLVSEMAEDVLEISDSCATQIRNGFVKGFQGLEVVKDLHEVPSDCAMAPVKQTALPQTLVVCRVSVNATSAVCPRTNARLRLIHLQKDQRQHMHETLLKMADAQFEAYDAKLEAKISKKKNSNKKNNMVMDKLDPDFAGKELKRFAHWLDERDGEPFTAIIDGANVAYFGLGKVNMFQIQMMVRALEHMGETPLVVLPQKYAQEKFYIRQGYVQSLSSEELQILQNLTDSGQLYVVPQRCLDDYYWMLASVSNQTNSQKGRQLDIDPNNELGRWPGLRPMLITNDRMRDHKLELLEPRLFRRWYGSHIVKYNISAFIEDTSEERDITFSTADFFSREIQGNPIQNTDSQSSHEMETVWHIPVSDWDKNDRLCIRIPQ